MSESDLSDLMSLSAIFMTLIDLKGQHLHDYSRYTR